MDDRTYDILRNNLWHSFFKLLRDQHVHGNIHLLAAELRDEALEEIEKLKL